jgi:hypothetical protein
MRPWAAGWLLAAAGAGCACGRKQTAAGARVRGCSGALYELLLTVVRAIRYRGTGYGPEYLLDGALPASNCLVGWWDSYERVVVLLIL